MTPVQATADKESIFNRVADYVSAAMGRPTNIMIWLVLVVGWTLLFAVHIVSANANFLPGWFTGTAFNFPLNLITTVAELFIGFLVAAAANRSERNLELTLAAPESACPLAVGNCPETVSPMIKCDYSRSRVMT